MIAILVIVGILVTFVPVIFLVFKIMGGVDKGSKETEALMQTGTVAHGRILNVQMGGMTVQTGVHRFLQLALTLEIQTHGAQPYHIQHKQLFSELQIPALQPGTAVEIRYDPQNPQRLTVSGIAMAQQAGYGQQGWGQQGWQQQGPQFQPVTPMRMPGAAKAGAYIGLAAGGIGVLVAIVSVWSAMGPGSVFSSFTSGSSADDDSADEDKDKSRKKTDDDKGDKDDKKPGDTKPAAASGACAEAVRCCKAVAGPGNAACDNFANPSIPETACTQAAKSYRDAAKRLGKSCD